VVCALADGRVLQFTLDINVVDRIKKDPEGFPAQINHKQKKEDGSGTSPSALWNMHFSTVGEIEASLKKVEPEGQAPFIIV
jgi:hypothetical protein